MNIEMVDSFMKIFGFSRVSPTNEELKERYEKEKKEKDEKDNQSTANSNDADK